MKLTDALTSLSEITEKGTVLLSPGPMELNVSSLDGLSARLLLWLTEQMPENATASDFHDVLDNAKWWFMYLQGLKVADTVSD